MSKPCLSSKNQRFSHPLRVMLVYLISLFLTMGLCGTLYASTEPDLDPDRNPSSNSKLLYTLLTAELAASRHIRDIALENYLNASVQSADPAVAEESTFLAINFEAPREAIRSAELWAQKDPTNIQAQLIAMTLLISQSIDKALPYLKHALEIDPKKSEQPILEIQGRLSKNSARNLTQALDKIARQTPNNPYIHLVAAASAAEQQDMQKANYWVDSALRQLPDFTAAITLKARLIRYTKNSDTPALLFLDQQLEKFPRNSELRFFYVSALLDDNKIEKAKIQLLRLTRDPIFGGPSFLLLGEIALQEKQWPEARRFLNKAQAFADSKDGSEYLLGKLEEQQDRIPLALSRYSNVEKGPYHIPAVLRAVALLKAQHAYKEGIYLMHNSSPTTQEEQKQLLLTELDLLNASQQSEEALQLVNEILAKLPDDLDLLWMRATTAIQLKQWAIARTDLQKILKKNPQDSKALQLLGMIPPEA